MNIFVIIATYNGMRWYNRCFNSLRASNQKVRILVIDNASADNTLTYIRKNYPEILLISEDKNLGFGKACNIGIKYALDKGADYFFFLNQDAWIEQDTLTNLLELFRILPDAGIVAPLQLNGAGNDLDTKMANTYLSHANTPGYLNDLYFNRVSSYYETQCINFAACMLSRKCIEKVGGFDTSLFYHYGEDWQYCQRVQYHGFKIFLTPKLIVYHDRADRKGKLSGDFEDQWPSISHKLHLGNILLTDSEFETLVNRNLREYGYSFLKSILKFGPAKIISLRNKYLENRKLLSQIRKSREINKKGLMAWL
jgi:GT2 family glycosyltransferase